MSEMRLHFGAGYRIYFRQAGETVTLLYGGDKHSQQADITKAREILRSLDD
jgi:putative addiction module killer protein